MGVQGDMQPDYFTIIFQHMFLYSLAIKSLSGCMKRKIFVQLTEEARIDWFEKALTKLNQRNPSGYLTATQCRRLA